MQASDATSRFTCFLARCRVVAYFRRNLGGTLNHRQAGSSVQMTNEKQSLATKVASGIAGRGAPLSELASLFLRLGTTAFGGPAAHIAMMEEEVVRRRGWLTREEFLDMLGMTNL